MNDTAFRRSAPPIAVASIRSPPVPPRPRLPRAGHLAGPFAVDVRGVLRKGDRGGDEGPPVARSPIGERPCSLTTSRRPSPRDLAAGSTHNGTAALLRSPALLFGSIMNRSGSSSK